MKCVGFIKEYNNIVYADELINITNSDYSIDYDIKKVIDYLNNGALLFGWMGYFVDIKTNELIAPDSYHTDGLWVWPSYFIYYLNKYPAMEINVEFIDYLKERNFIVNIPKDFNDIRNKLENELSLILDGKPPNYL